MNWLDVVLLVLIVGGALSGMRFGLVKAVTSLVSFGIGISLGSRLGSRLQPLIELFTENETAQQVGGFLIVLLLVLALGMLVSSVVMKGLVTVKLGWVNTVGGLVVGAVMIMSGASSALASVQDVSLLASNSTIEGSLVATFLADNFDGVLRGIRLIPTDFGV